MKYKKLLLSAILILSVPYISLAQKTRPNFIKVEFAGFGIETFDGIDCDHYSHKMTTKSKVFKQVKDVITFDSIASLFKEKNFPVSLTTAQENTNIDSRGTITFVYDRSYVHYCFDYFGVFYRDGKRFDNKTLMILIIDKLYGKHPDYLDKN